MWKYTALTLLAGALFFAVAAVLFYLSALVAAQ